MGRQKSNDLWDIFWITRFSASFILKNWIFHDLFTEMWRMAKYWCELSEIEIWSCVWYTWMIMNLKNINFQFKKFTFLEATKPESPWKFCKFELLTAFSCNPGEKSIFNIIFIFTRTFSRVSVWSVTIYNFELFFQRNHKLQFSVPLSCMCFLFFRTHSHFTSISNFSTHRENREIVETSVSVISSIFRDFSTSECFAFLKFSKISEFFSLLSIVCISVDDKNVE